jgi:cell division protein FtsI/penicillin-binding protein 2
VKIVTASAALEQLNFSPGTKISYRSGIYDVSRMDLKTPESKRFPRMSLTDAISKSANNVFGKVAAKYLGREPMLAYFDKFYFSREIPFDLPVEKSSVSIPDNKFALARAGAGFGKIMISPIHGAMIGAAIANEGFMMKPYIVESIKDSRGNVLYISQNEPLGRIIKKDTAADVLRMMKKTLTSGTLRKTFSRRKWRYFAKKFDIAGKTGSITWGPPRRHYEWVLGIAPVVSPSICFVSLTGNTDLWHIKSTYVAREALAEFFNYNYKKLIRKRKRRGKKREKG